MKSIQETQNITRHKIPVSFYVVYSILLILFFVFVFVFTPAWLQFNDIAFSDILRILALLLFIALVFERFMEVFISTWFSPGEANLKNRISKNKKHISWLEKNQNFDSPKEKDNTFKKAIDEVAMAEDDLISHKSRVKRIALASSFLLGLFIAATGIRAIEPLIESVPDNIQGSFFRLFDILLTGGLIAGGSEGIHKITQFLTDFFEKSSVNINNK